MTGVSGSPPPSVAARRIATRAQLTVGGAPLDLTAAAFSPRPELQENCGVMGVFHPNSFDPSMIVGGLHHQQRRGFDGAGIAWQPVSLGASMEVIKGEGTVRAVFEPHLGGPLFHVGARAGIGHVRYRTKGTFTVDDLHPFVISLPDGSSLAVAHNGQLTNACKLRSGLAAQGFEFRSSSDSEVIPALICAEVRARPQQTVASALAIAINKLEGSYSLVILHGQEIYAARDPFANRPLSIARYSSGHILVASENSTFEALNREWLLGYRTDEREVQGGEVVRIRSFPDGNPLQRKSSGGTAHCILETVYFHNPNASLHNESVSAMRRAMGAKLAQELESGTGGAHAGVASLSLNSPNLLMVPVLNSGREAALGVDEYARRRHHEKTSPYTESALTIDPTAPRAFILPEHLRANAVAQKHHPNPTVVADKDILLIDDTLVRGDTMRTIVELLRSAGARTVHVALACPPIQNPCFWGIAISTWRELLAHGRTLDAMREAIRADSLHFLSLGGLLEAVSDDRGDRNCTFCLTGEHRMPLPDGVGVPDGVTLRRNFSP